MVPPFVTAGFLRTALQRHLCTVYNYTGKIDLGKGCSCPNIKLGAAMHFSEIVKLKLPKKSTTLSSMVKLFRVIVT